MLALQGTRALAREGRKLSAIVKGQAARVRDRSRSVGRTVRAISRTLGRRTGQAKAQVIELNSRAGAQMARSAREARRLAAQARRAARGRGAKAKLAAAARLEQLAGRCEKVCEQIDRRARGLKITDRLVSLSDPDARPIRKGKLGKPTEFGYVVQVAEVTENTRRGARGFILPPATMPGNPAENRLLPTTVTELERLGIRPSELVGDGGSRPARRSLRCPKSRPSGSSSRAATNRAHGAPANAARVTAPASKGASATSNAATGCAAAASRAIKASRSGPAGRSSPTTSTRSPSEPPDSIPARPPHTGTTQPPKRPRHHPGAAVSLQPFIRGK
jgi:hypothetical protein